MAALHPVHHPLRANTAGSHTIHKRGVVLTNVSDADVAITTRSPVLCGSMMLVSNDEPVVCAFVEAVGNALPGRVLVLAAFGFCPPLC